MEGQIRKVLLSEEVGDFLLVPDIPEDFRDREGMFDLDKDIVWNSISGMHGIIGHSCGGNFRYRRLSETHATLACNQCYRRIIFPREVKDFYALHDFLKKQRNGEVSGKIIVI